MVSAVVAYLATTLATISYVTAPQFSGNTSNNLRKKQTKDHIHSLSEDSENKVHISR